ncbi:MAG TPA: exo-beta-N-acetylmuramidase NamZ domain-containing protein [Thermoanaerobaculia bacterium]|nr:exo-beta-N-acetylmuramidase NamZ domain-containing protein [Thermoanaerobaculia bacterium]
MPRRLLPLLFVFFAACATTHTPLDQAIDTAIAQKKIPGGVLWVEHDGHPWHRAYGNRAIEPAVEPITDDTIYDAASLTKVIATAPSIWLLIQRGKLQLDDRAQQYLPEFSDGDVTLRHLLTHTSGLRPDIDLDEPWSGHAEGIRRALAETPRNRPGAVFRYSDINYLLLGEIIQRVSGEPLDVFAQKNVFAPLGMRDTRFTPQPSARIAPTERDVPRGVVHDPTSRRMGGVAGHAGLFTTAADVATFARALLNGGGGVFTPETIRAMTSVQSPPDVLIRRAAGFDIDSGYSRPRGDHFPVGSFGHTGFTGTMLWIDPASRTFYVFMSNRVHPDGRGSVTSLQCQLGTLVAESVGVMVNSGNRFARGRVTWITGGADVMNGIDALHADRYRALQGMRIGLITNPSGSDRSGNPTIDLLRSAPGVQLAALFSPEHGIRGTFDAKVADESDPVTKLPVFSLYGERRKPSPEQLQNLDALVFDVQDIGTRFYTYIATMGLAMEAAAAAHVKFIVLDRVNPIGGDVVEGPLLEGAPDFTAFHSLPIRHGMTVGELAQMFKDERHIDVDLTVIKLHNWHREMWQDAAGLGWTDTSPNMRSLAAAGLYPGIGLLERAISVGRGTATPFEILGAPYIDGDALARALPALPGVSVTPARFTPEASVFANQECGGIRLAITDRRAFRAVDTGVAIAATLARLYPHDFKVDELAPLLRDRITLEAIRAGKTTTWDLAPFLARRAKYLLY